MFPFVRPLNIHPSGGGYYAMNFSALAEADRYINVPIIKHDYEIYPEKKSDLAICVIPANEYAMKQYRITKPFIKQYAEKCGADLIELFGDACPHWPLTNKYRLFFVTARYERTLFLDVDIIVNENSPNIFDLTPKDKFCILDESTIIQKETFDTTIDLQQQVAEYFNLPLRTNVRMYNAGVMVIPNNLAQYYSQPLKTKTIKIPCVEQAYMDLTIPDSDVYLLDEKFNHLYFHKDFWKEMHNAYFIHLAGSNPLEYRLELLKRISNKNYKPLLPPDESNGKPDWIKHYVV